MTLDWPFGPEASWLVAELHPPGIVRARAVLAALEGMPGPLDDRHLRLAWEVGVEEARALRLEGARAIQEELHRRATARWSANDLGLTLARLGESARADQVLADQIVRSEALGEDTSGLWSQRGIWRLGIGDEARARDYLGIACALGSHDAAAVLARLDLARGERERARANLRALLAEGRTHPWGLRGFGLSLLPETRPLPRAD